MKEWYRIGNIESTQGLWYNMNGEFTGLIHGNFSFCKSSELQMPFDANIVGYLSVVENMRELYEWFSKEDIQQLHRYGYRVLKYASDDYKLYGHWLIKKDTAKLVKVYE